MADTLITNDGTYEVFRREDGTEYAVLVAGGPRDNELKLREQAAAALDTNATFLAIASPTNAQNAAQLKAVTRQVNGIIRLVLSRLDTTDGT